jgi:CHAT domain-containing protein
MRAAEEAVGRCSGGGDEDCTWALQRRAEAHLARGETAAAISDVTAALARIEDARVATFARAFIYAGTPSVVASIWDVPDTATSRLIGAFYQSWLKGASKSGALRNAQLSLLRDLRAGRVSATTPAGSVVLPEHPIFWAGFSLIGEPE